MKGICNIANRHINNDTSNQCVINSPVRNFHKETVTARVITRYSHIHWKKRRASMSWNCILYCFTRFWRRFKLIQLPFLILRALLRSLRLSELCLKAYIIRAFSSIDQIIFLAAYVNILKILSLILLDFRCTCCALTKLECL